MSRSKGQPQKGVALLITLTTLLVVILLASVILSLIANQSRLTHHSTSRIQALYAARAGMNYALDRLRIGSWSFSPNSCPPGNPYQLVDANFPASINSIRIVFCPVGLTCLGSNKVCSPPSGYTHCINTVVDYLYVP